MATLVPSPRRGITLMEVLIAIGILAIGLSSVVAILPAAKSQATRAVVLDRASGLAANLLADAATFGLVREGALSQTPDPALNQIAIIDPAAASNAYSTAIPSVVQPALRNSGIFSTTATTLNAPPEFHRLFTEGRDDVLLGDPATPDDPPTHFFVDGARAYQGRMTALLAMKPPAASPQYGTLSVVVFHNRDVSQLVVEGLLQGVELTIPASNLPPGRTFRDLVKPGVVIYANGRFHQLMSAATPPAGSTSTAYVTTSTGATFAPSTAVVIFPDSVGLAERPYTPEVDGAFLR
jgi:prepilin-type N-terminal cleavage/methylation domain-containing protein